MDLSSHHQPALVALSVAVAIFTAYVALDLSGRQRTTTGAARWAWLSASAVAMGGGIWSMHFIGMLAMTMAVPVAYDVTITLVSLVLPIAVTGGGLAIARCDEPSWRRLAAGGLLMGGGIGLMHYLGMAAMTMDAAVTYNPRMVALSMLIAVAASTAALRLACAVQSSVQRAASAVVMGGAVVGMHYVGMAAATFTVRQGASAPWFQAPPIEPRLLALQVAAVTGIVLALALTSSTLARRGAEARIRETEDRFARERARTEERLRLAVQATGLGTWDWDLTADALLWSDRTYVLLGLPAGAEASYAAFLNALHPEDRAATDAAVKAALDPTGDGRFTAEFRALRPGGEPCWVSSQGQTHFEESGDGRRRAVRFLGTLLDVTARRQAEERLRASLMEKEMLLREIHHRVKNNMQAITAILQLEAAQVSDPAAREGFAAVGRRLQAMARLHEQLYSAQDLRRIDLRSYFGELGQGLAALHTGVPVGIELEVEPLACDLDVAMPLGLIANELVTNSLKHAFPDGRSGTIRIRLARNGASVLFEVSDDGVGSDGGGRAKGLGKRLIAALAQQLHAEMDIERVGGYRTRFLLPADRFEMWEEAGVQEPVA
ncbi:MHYT domain-containing protein [Azospirillum sp. sgz302134]